MEVTTSWSPAATPLVICVPESPASPTVTGVTVSTPFSRNVTVLCPPAVVMAAVGAQSTAAASAVVTTTLALIPALSPSGTAPRVMVTPYVVTFAPSVGRMSTAVTVPAAVPPASASKVIAAVWPTATLVASASEKPAGIW